MRTSFFAFIIFLNIGICRAQQDIRIQKPAQIENTSRKQASLRDVFNQLQTTPLVLGKKLKDKDLKICLLLPYKSSRAFAFIQENIEPNELKSKPRLLPADIKNVLDFHLGVKLAVEHIRSTYPDLRFEVYCSDTRGNDSILDELLTDKNILQADIIIGPSDPEGAKKVAEFCKQRRIINIQPFLPARSLTHNNPYHIKIAPTIEAHIDNIFRSITDSFLKQNIIIYTTNSSRDRSAAERLDSLLKNYSSENNYPVNVSLCNPYVKNASSEKKNLSELIHPHKLNVIVGCVFDEANAQLITRQLASYNGRVMLYCMPNWLNSEIIRLDYLNKLNTRLTEPFWEDTIENKKAIDFVNHFRDKYGFYPSKYSWLGYDTFCWLAKSINETESFPEQIRGTFYAGAGYKFQFRAVEKAAKNEPENQIDYYENTFLHLLKIEDYQLKKIW